MLPGENTTMIKIYSTPTCPYCEMAKEYFKKNDIAYEDINVLEDMNARQEMFQKSNQMGVPVIDIDGKIIVGFDRSAIDELIAGGQDGQKK
jgi:glutaredoxin-like YruB-family protein